VTRYDFRGRDRRGGLVRGVREAESAEAVAAELMAVDIVPVEISPERPRTDWARLLAPLRGRRFTTDQLILFSRQMHGLTRAGVPLSRGLESLLESLRPGPFRDALVEIRGALDEGRDLAGAMAHRPDVFPPLYVSIVRVGEQLGKLDEAFARLHVYLTRDKTTRQQIVSALRYPAVVVVAMAVAVWIITVKVIPIFAHVYAHFHARLPWATRLILAVSDFAARYWIVVTVVVVAGVVAARFYLKTPQGRYAWDRIKLRIPVVGGIALRGSLARFARAFAMSYRAGLPIVQALGLIARGVGNEFVAERILAMRAGIERGESIFRTAHAVGLFTPVVLQMLRVGDETGAIDDMMDEVATFYEEEVAYEVRNLSTLIEPFLVVALGIMVLILALGVFLPMWDLIQVVQH
jgi:MSHA biogenesis protein MshG